MRRLTIFFATLLTILMLSGGTASAGPNDVHLYSQPNFSGTEVVIPATQLDVCIEVDPPARAVLNHSGFTIKLYASLIDCLNDIPIAILAPYSSIVWLDVPVQYIRIVW